MTLGGSRDAGSSTNSTTLDSAPHRQDVDAREVAYDPTFVDWWRIGGYGRRRANDVNANKGIIKFVHKTITKDARGGAEAPDRC